MSPAAGRRFVVKVYDYEHWSIVVEAKDHRDAIRKAERVYETFAFGDSFQLDDRQLFWRASPLVQEVQR